MHFFIFINDMLLFINETYAEIYAGDTTVQTAHKDQSRGILTLIPCERILKGNCITAKVILTIT